jgi:TetR/AcrR family transcriptional regulator, regulator of mycofactocin system
MTAQIASGAPDPGAPGTSSGWDARRVRVARQIEEAAMHLFATYGFAAVTVADIGRAVGISDRTVFRYFPSKDDVLRALPRRILDAIHEELGRQGPDVPTLTALRRALRAADATIGDRQSLLRWGRVCASLPAWPVGSEAVAGEAYRDFLMTRLGAGPGAELRVDIIASALAAAQSRSFEEWLRRGARGDLAAMSDQALRVLAEFGSQLAADL